MRNAFYLIAILGCAIGGLAVSALVMRLIFFLCEHTLFHELAPAFAVITTAAIMWPIAMLMNKLDAIRLRL
jgi:hypothetical protein